MTDEPPESPTRLTMNRIRITQIVTLFFSLLLLTACGLKGDLYLGDSQKPANKSENTLNSDSRVNSGDSPKSDQQLHPQKLIPAESKNSKGEIAKGDDQP